jgi:hypothetical protein
MIQQADKTAADTTGVNGAAGGDQQQGESSSDYGGEISPQQGKSSSAYGEAISPRELAEELECYSGGGPEQQWGTLREEQKEFFANLYGGILDNKCNFSPELKIRDIAGLLNERLSADREGAGPAEGSSSARPDAANAGAGSPGGDAVGDRRKVTETVAVGEVDLKTVLAELGCEPGSTFVDLSLDNQKLFCEKYAPRLRNYPAAQLRLMQMSSLVRLMNDSSGAVKAGSTDIDDYNPIGLRGAQELLAMYTKATSQRAGTPGEQNKRPGNPEYYAEGGDVFKVRENMVRAAGLEFTPYPALQDTNRKAGEARIAAAKAVCDLFTGDPGRRVKAAVEYKNLDAEVAKEFAEAVRAMGNVGLLLVTDGQGKTLLEKAFNGYRPARGLWGETEVRKERVGYMYWGRTNEIVRSRRVKKADGTGFVVKTYRLEGLDEVDGKGCFIVEFFRNVVQPLIAIYGSEYVLSGLTSKAPGANSQSVLDVLCDIIMMVYADGCDVNRMRYAVLKTGVNTAREILEGALAGVADKHRRDSLGEKIRGDLLIRATSVADDYGCYLGHLISEDKLAALREKYKVDRVGDRGRTGAPGVDS